ncbi:MAG: hypothetical protein CMK36_02970 [Porticoccaceae bacterium]|nr:hypothetical protein [Porticoccaceae bacterium]|tara:strand:+ start:87 stop:809 length:723 start_codon:yes stop_codon:yes gene_type:complete
MLFCFTVGVEGTGHHMVRALLHTQMQRDRFIDQGGWHEAMVTHWDPRTRHQKVNALQQDLKSVFQEAAQQGATHLYESASFPFNQPRDALRRPDILEFLSLTQGLVRCRFLVLYRCPKASTFSAVRRGFTDDVLKQARIVEANHRFIAQQLQQCPRESYRVLRYEDFMARPRDFQRALAEWWELDPFALALDLSRLKPSYPWDRVPKDTRAVLDAFFSAKKRALWEPAYGNSPLLDCVTG